MAPTQTCRYFARGNCTNPRCTFAHEGTGASTVAVRIPQAKVIEATLPDGTTEKISVQKTRRQLVFSCAIDTSGSMAGGRLKAAVAALTDIAENAMDGNDRYALCSFASQVTVLHNAKARSGIDVARDARQLSTASGGRTALWDGVRSAIESVQEYQASLGGNRPDGPQPIYEVVVVTDGEDTASSVSLSEVCALAAKPRIPDFNLIIIGVGNDVNQTELQQLCRPQHCHFIHASDVEALKTTLAKVVRQIKMRLEVKTSDGVQKVKEFVGKEAYVPGKLREWAQNGESQLLQKADEVGQLKLLGDKLGITLTITESGEGEGSVDSRRSTPVRSQPTQHRQPPQQRQHAAARNCGHRPPTVPPPKASSQSYQIGDQVEAQVNPSAQWLRATVVRIEAAGLRLLFDGQVDTVIVAKSRVRAR